jgi:probable F420-dependent oxidoreductase
MRFDCFHDPRVTDAAGAAVRAAREGYDGFWMPETRHDPFLPLAVAVPGTERMTLGTSIAVAFARSPMTLAYTAWDLAASSGGRFVLGLGPQIRAHVVGRYSMPWSAAAPRMREFIGALRAIWTAWQTGDRLRYRGEHYRFSLMTPFFDPGPIDHPAVPIHLAAVGPGMARLVGEVADGIHLHPFHTRSYVEGVVRPAIVDGALGVGRDPSVIHTVAALFVVTGENSHEMERASGEVRRQIAFYASTPAYRPVLAWHDWDVGERLTAMSRRREWDTMGDLIDDDMLREVAVVAPWNDLPAALAARIGGSIDRCGLYPSGGLDPFEPRWMEVVKELRTPA